MMIIVIYCTVATKAERVINLFRKVLIEQSFLSRLMRNSTSPYPSVIFLLREVKLVEMPESPFP